LGEVEAGAKRLLAKPPPIKQIKLKSYVPISYSLLSQRVCAQCRFSEPGKETDSCICRNANAYRNSPYSFRTPHKALPLHEGARKSPCQLGAAMRSVTQAHSVLAAGMGSRRRDAALDSLQHSTQKLRAVDVNNKHAQRSKEALVKIMLCTHQAHNLKLVGPQRGQVKFTAV
jgi:hypothetical protein